MKQTFFATLLLCAGLVSGAAHAALIETDWKISGDKQATLDTETGIEWLDVSLTRGKSINQVIAELNTLYKGWRLPSQNEVFALFQHAFSASSPTYVKQGSATAYYNFNVYDYEHHNFTFAFGDTYTPWYSYGAYVAQDGSVKVSGAGGNGAQTSSVVYINYARGTLNEGSFYDGVFLVSDGGVTLSSISNPTLNANNPNAPVNNQLSDVSAPLSPLTIGIASLVLAFTRRNKKIKG